MPVIKNTKDDRTINRISADKCLGCAACSNACPQNAITMVPNHEGFAYPEISPAECVNCGVCLSVCAVNKGSYDNSPEPTCHAVMASDEIRMSSSSGGVFSLLADSILELGGVVCGAAYTNDYYGVYHKVIETKNEVEQLRGSKYVQSDMKNVYREIKHALDADRYALFVGTPCQVAAVKTFLAKPYEKLYTVDLVCHGVPSPKTYEQFVKEKELEYGAKATRVSFRDKAFGKWNHTTLIEFSNGEAYKKRRKSECWYLNAFLKLANLRECCGACPYAKFPRQGDLTIGDFWDIRLYNPSLDDEKGTSLVLCNNEKGKWLLSCLQNHAILFEEAPIEHAKKYNYNLGNSSTLHKNRERFYKLISKYAYSFEKAAEYSLNDKYDIGYVGWWYGKNYGSAITSFAMNRVLKDMNKTVLMLDFPSAPLQNTASRRFAKNFYDIGKSVSLEEQCAFNRRCDMFLVGSDQLWNWWSNRDIGTYYFFLDFADKWHKKISYSTSFGHESGYYPEEMRMRIGYYLSRFDAISVREKSAITILKRDYDIDAIQTVDPVFLCSQDNYEDAIALSTLSFDKPYVLGYILNPTRDKIESIRYIAQAMSLDYHIILDGQGDFEALRKEANDPQVVDNVEIADWLKYFNEAQYVVTDSFHGYCFSIIFKKNFSVFPNKLRGLTRFENLAALSGVSDRFVSSCDELICQKPWLRGIDYDAVELRMKPSIDFSRQWLQNAVDMKHAKPNVKTLQYEAYWDLLARVETLEKKCGIRKKRYNYQWFKKKFTGGIKCLKENGIGYTVRHFFDKCRRWRQRKN